ncbi:general transcription factor [Lithospermum erythrorhizon]|uniref:General transcription factor n=1 Tax=Lithospermum erythrorhizon TaxID=34254 RepID=A0AAV3QBE6_LITER
MSCKSCYGRSLVMDDVTGDTVCSSCGVVQDFDNFQAHFGGISGPTGTYVRLGTAGTGNVYGYKETKIYEAQKVIEDTMFKLGLSGSRSNEVKAMIDKITEGEYGQGSWFPVLTGACAYVVMRKDNNTLPISEVANFVGCDIHELGRMVSRVVEFLELKLPEFDIVDSLERAIKTCPSFSGVSADLSRRMLKQGVFLVQCLIKWFVTTGRRPIPVVAAVLVFVATLNQVDVKINELAKELHVAVATCKKRYKELLVRLVEVARVLPWGEDVTTKNIINNAPYVIQYMEMKSMEKRGENNKHNQDREFCLDDLIDQCLSKDLGYGYGSYGLVNDSQYFEPNLSNEFPDELQLSQECLAMVYAKFLDEASLVKSISHVEEGNCRKRATGHDLFDWSDWWNGKSKLSKKLMLKQILEQDVGLNYLPPSFEWGCKVYEIRKKKIEAAKSRIQTTMSSSSENSLVRNDCFVEDVNMSERKRKRQFDIDWEDFIIETLLLHQVKEEEIGKGHYNTLLDLYVFCDENVARV